MAHSTAQAPTSPRAVHSIRSSMTTGRRARSPARRGETHPDAMGADDGEDGEDGEGAFSEGANDDVAGFFAGDMNALMPS